MDKRLKDIQKEFINKLDELNNRLDIEVKTNKRRRVIERIKKEIDKEDNPS